jgi:transcriptional regulator with XRE-family HTH domain
MRAKGFTYRQIAKKFGVGAGTVGSILRGEHWQHIHAEFPNQPLMIYPGFLKGEANVNAKLTESKVQQIFHMQKEGFTQRQIAKKIGIDQSGICQVLQRKRFVTTASTSVL